MKFASTRSLDRTVTFRQAVFKGLAPDGGLYVPLADPDLKSAFLSMDETTPFVSIAETICRPLMDDDFDAEAISRIAQRAFPFEPVLHPLDPTIRVVELFHGPSCAFKDFGASFLASAMEEILREDKRRAVILVATSGDTGSAVAQAFFGKANIDVVILYPSGRVSPLQEKQLTTLGGNIAALEVKGNFDDCQRMVKDAFVDPALNERVTLTSANSISLGRLLPQAFYYIHAFSRVRKILHGELFITVPSGNFGNLTAGVYAWRWGLPVTAFIAATNANRVVPEYLESGIFSPRPSVQTLSNAMDVGNPSNFERLLHLFQNRLEGMQAMIHGETVSDMETVNTIREVYETYGYVADPHTAVGILATQRYRDRIAAQDSTFLTLSTAHPGKFLEVIEEALGFAPKLPESLQVALTKTKSSLVVENKTEALKEYLLKRFG